MLVRALRSDRVYQKMLDAAPDKRDDIYRYEMMQPFEGHWACYRTPIKAPQKGGYDVVMASGMLGILAPSKIDEGARDSVRLLADDAFWAACQASVERSLKCFAERGITLPTSEYLFTALIGDPEHPSVRLSDNYLGVGGIPGYMFGILVPSAHTLRHMPAAMAHETNHNVRFQFIQWRDDITLAEMMVTEGLAENFAVSLFGEEQAGPWVSKTDMETLNEWIKPIIREGLDAKGLENLSAYLYGDELANAMHYFPVGLPYCSGYACGYHMIRHYLKKTGKSIVDATILPAAEILSEIEDFWDTPTTL